MRKTKMGACKNKRLIGPYLDGQLGECRWLDEHIGECSQCLIEYETIQKMNHLAGKLDMAPPESHYWKNFSARTMARIAASEAQAVKSRSWLFFTGYKKPIRIFSLVASIVLVIGTSLILNNQRQKLPVAITNQGLPIGLAETPAPQTESPQLTNQFQTADIVAPKSIQTVSNGSELDDNSAGRAEPVESAPSELTYSESNPELIGQFRYVSRAQTNLIEPDIPVGTGTIQSDILEPNTDMVIVYQINQGSKAGEIPLMIYRQATVKFFGPDKAMPWRNINRLTSPNWGFAAGDWQADEHVNNRLNMELDLSQDK